MDVDAKSYSAVNSGDADRVVLMEQPRRANGWSLGRRSNAAETAPNLYRFKFLSPHTTSKLEVREHGPEYDDSLPECYNNQSVICSNWSSAFPSAES